MKTIYGLRKDGKIKVAKFYTDGAHKIVETGMWGGKFITNDTVCTEKNAGRSNFVSASEQAVLDIDRDIKKKVVQEFYREIPEAIEGNESLILEFLQNNIDKSSSPMLAERFDKFKHKVDYTDGVLGSNKLDGNRCEVVAWNGVVTMLSRSGLPITTMPHIVKQVMDIHLRSMKNFKLDGELYNHCEDEDNFDDLQSAIMKYYEGISEQVEYHVYDMIHLDGVSAIKRYEFYYEFLTFYKTTHIIPERQEILRSENEVVNFFHKATSNGYEGAIIRKVGAFYQHARTQDMLKVKEMQEGEFKIVDVIPMLKRPEFARVVLCTADGQLFKATPKCTEAKKIEMLQNREMYIDKVGTLQYFSITSKGKPRLPVFKGLRSLADMS